MPSRPKTLPLGSRGLEHPDFPERSPYSLGPGIPAPGAPSPLRHPFGNIVVRAGQECLPAVHRLRQFGLALGPA